MFKEAVHYNNSRDPKMLAWESMVSMSVMVESYVSLLKVVSIGYLGK